MEGFLESFIYLLITIVILVLSMRNKKKVEPEGEESSAPEHPFSDLFGDEGEEDDNVTLQPETLQEEHVDQLEKPSPWMSETDARSMVMDADQIIKEAAENNPIARLEGEVEDDVYGIGHSDDGGISFDLKKAVIYSEIIQRKVF